VARAGAVCRCGACGVGCGGFCRRFVRVLGSCVWVFVRGVGVGGWAVDSPHFKIAYHTHCHPSKLSPIRTSIDAQLAEYRQTPPTPPRRRRLCWCISLPHVEHTQQGFWVAGDQPTGGVSRGYRSPNHKPTQKNQKKRPPKKIKPRTPAANKL